MGGENRGGGTGVCSLFCTAGNPVFHLDWCFAASHVDIRSKALTYLSLDNLLKGGSNSLKTNDCWNFAFLFYLV